MLILPWKAFFLLMIISGTFLAISAPSWFIAWMGLEINMLSLLAILLSYKTPRNSEASLKYFLVQALASALLISAALLSCYSKTAYTNPSTLIALSLLIKLGGAPFHFWIPQVIEGLEWVNCGLVLIWQKVAPFILLSSFSKTKLFMIPLVLSAFIGALGGLAQISTRKILAFSSINHISWLMFSLMHSMTLWLSYYLIYSVLMISTLFLLYKNNLCSISQSVAMNENLSLMLVMLSLGGLPPLLGFAPKWMVINSLSFAQPMITLTLALLGLLTLFFYIRMATLSFSLNPSSLFPLMNKNSTSLIIYLNIVGLLLASPLMI